MPQVKRQLSAFQPLTYGQLHKREEHTKSSK